MFCHLHSFRTLVPSRSSSHAFIALRCAILTVLGSLLLGSVQPAFAQDPLTGDTAGQETKAKIDGQINLRGSAGIPVGGFGANIGTGGGLHFFIGGYLEGLPLTLGLDVGYIGYGRSLDTMPISQTIGPRVTVDVETRNSVVQPHLVLRLQPKTGIVRPFLDGLVGFKYLFTRTSIRDNRRLGNPGDRVATTTNYDDIAFSAGGGAGVDLRLYQQGDPSKDIRSISLHVGVQYLWGGRAAYLTEGELIDADEDGQLNGDELPVRRSRTTLLQPQIGVTFQL